MDLIPQFVLGCYRYFSEHLCASQCWHSYKCRAQGRHIICSSYSPVKTAGLVHTHFIVLIRTLALAVSGFGIGSCSLAGGNPREPFPPPGKGSQAVRFINHCKSQSVQAQQSFHNCFKFPVTV